MWLELTISSIFLINFSPSNTAVEKISDSPTFVASITVYSISVITFYVASANYSVCDQAGFIWR